MILKFRVWIKDYQVMRSVEFLAFNKKGVAEVFTNPEDGEPEDFRCTHVPKQIIIMQSTGLKDDNGVEIYEDDIVLCEWGEIGDNIYRNTGKTVVNSSPHNLVMLEEADRLQILGNIYENPELVREVKK